MPTFCGKQETFLDVGTTKWRICHKNIVIWDIPLLLLFVAIDILIENRLKTKLLQKEKYKLTILVLTNNFQLTASRFFISPLQ